MRPLLERAHRLDPDSGSAGVSHMPGPQNGQPGSHELAPMRARDLVDLALERAGFRPLHAGVELPEQGAPGQVVGDDQVVAVDREQGGDRHLDVAAEAQLAHAQFPLRQRLAQQLAIDLATAIVERDDAVAAEQLGAEALLGFLLARALRDDRRGLAVGQPGGDIDQQRLAGPGHR